MTDQPEPLYPKKLLREHFDDYFKKNALSQPASRGKSNPAIEEFGDLLKGFLVKTGEPVLANALAIHFNIAFGYGRPATVKAARDLFKGKRKKYCEEIGVSFESAEPYFRAAFDVPDEQICTIVGVPPGRSTAIVKGNLIYVGEHDLGAYVTKHFQKGEFPPFVSHTQERFPLRAKFSLEGFL